MSDSKLTVVITGASAGVGRATARAYGQRGANVGLIARGAEGLAAAAAEVEAAGGTPEGEGHDGAPSRHIGMGGADRRSKARWIPIALAAKGAFDSVAGVYLTVE